MDLLAQARRLGIETDYVDARGQPRRVSADVVARIAEALEAADPGAPAASETPAMAVRQAYPGPPGRSWTLAVQLYAVRSSRNWGHGDFADLRTLVELAAELGAAGIGLNPLHVLFDEAPDDPSPYSPNSRLFLNPLYIAIDEIEDLPGALPDVGAAAPAEEIARLRRTELVDYPAVAALKQRCLRAAYRGFAQHAAPERREEFEAFRRSRAPALARFACFEVLRARLGRPWWQWPAEWQDPDDSALARLRAEAGEEIELREYIQWIADRQLMRCRDRARELGLPIGLYIDVAVGVQPDGFDAWNTPDALIRTLAIGAPPDLLNTAGQNWGLAGFSGVGLQAHAFAPYRDMLRAAMRYAGAIRIDHVLGLKRLYFIPEGLPPDQGAYVRMPFEQMLNITAEESVRHRCIVIGEDLGTVPEGFRAQLTERRIWSYQVLLFERDAAGAFSPPTQYREHAVAAFSTHDLPTFAGWINGDDLRTKKKLGIDPGETGRERTRAVAQLRRAVRMPASATPDLAATVRFLAGSPAKMLIVAIEDTLGVRDQVNIPGTVDEHPNWRRKLPVDLDRLAQHAELRTIARIAAESGRSAVRAGTDHDASHRWNSR